MLRPDEIKEYHNPDLKLGIKSSLPRVKSTLGLFFMLWKASDKNCEITYSQIDGDSTILIEDLKSKLIDIFAPIYESYGVSDDEFTAGIPNCSIRINLEGRKDKVF